jgi:signal transduction histidine kinase
LKVEVNDTGIGMNKETLDMLFDIDKSQSTLGTNGEKNSGLGLVLCKEFVEKNNGKLTVKS